jgi:fatty-acid desaturase
VLLLGQLSGVLYLDLAAVAVSAVIVWLVAAVILALGYRSFRRERLLVAG